MMYLIVNLAVKKFGESLSKNGTDKTPKQFNLFM